MTREDYLRKLEDCGTNEDVKILFGQIFDDLESRTCDKCEYTELDEDPNTHKIWGICGNKAIPFFPEGIDFQINFGCNKFEPKNAKNS